MNWELYRFPTESEGWWIQTCLVQPWLLYCCFFFYSLFPGHAGGGVELNSRNRAACQVSLASASPAFCVVLGFVLWCCQVWIGADRLWECNPFSFQAVEFVPADTTVLKEQSVPHALWKEFFWFLLSFKLLPLGRLVLGAWKITKQQIMLATKLPCMKRLICQQWDTGPSGCGVLCSKAWPEHFSHGVLKLFPQGIWWWGLCAKLWPSKR